MGHIPGGASVSLIQKKSVIEAISIVPPILTAIVTAWIYYDDPNRHSAALVLSLGAAWLLIASAVKILHAHYQDKKEVQQKSYDGLLGAMHVLYANVSKHLQDTGTNSEQLRITMHRVQFEEGKNDPIGLEQMLPYIGGKGGGAGRVFPINPGIIGLVARSGEVRAASRADDDHAAFIKELVSKWFYTESAARNLTADRKAWLAVPILGKDKTVLVVVYLDSDIRDSFDDSTIELILNGCAGIATYISERYALHVISATSPKSSQKTKIEKVVDVSAEGASLKEQHVVLTGDAERELTSTAASLIIENAPQKT